MSVQTTMVFSNLQEIDILYKNKVKCCDMPKVKASQDAYDYLLSVWSPHIGRIEEFVILCLNRSNKVLGWSKIGQGGLAGTVADPKVIFQVALKSNASSLILCHNHPSQNIKPSDTDIALTKKLKNAGAFLDLQVLDHLIISSEGYYSFADEGII